MVTITISKGLLAWAVFFIACAYHSGATQDVRSFVVFAVHCFLLWLQAKWCKWCGCCQRRQNLAAQPTASEPTAQPWQLQKRKRLSTSYLLWLIGGPLGNAHHFYLERLTHGIFGIWTVNLIGLGWVLDFFFMPCYVRSFNSRYAAEKAEKDGTRWLLFGRLPMILLAVAMAVIGGFCYTPWLLQRTGVVDIDRMAAQTQVSPYKVLELPRGGTMTEVKSAYRRLSKEWHPDHNPNCGKRCDDKMAEINKAFDAIKKRQAPLPEDNTWGRWLEHTLEDWGHVMREVFQDGPD
jgi:TM2 domain-containing membrane protein YozV